MNSIFNMDNKFFSVMSKIADLIILNILWTLCSIPVITMGATTTALYYVTLKMAKDEESYIVKSFFKSFIQNFKQATGIWLILLAGGGIVLGDIYIITKWDTRFKIPLMVIFIALLLILSFIFMYVFPLLAQFDNTVKQTIKNALLMSIRHLPYTILIFIITAVPLLLYSVSIPLMYVSFMIGFSMIAFFNSIFFKKIFIRYMPEEALEEAVSDDDFTADCADRGDYSVFSNPIAGRAFESTAALMEELNAANKEQEENKSDINMDKN